MQGKNAEFTLRNETMKKKPTDWKDRLGVVFSTNPDFTYDSGDVDEMVTLPAGQQNLRVLLDRKQRKGKEVTLVKGFAGAGDDLKNLGKLLKTRCGTGGAEKNGEILIQGDFCDKVIEILKKEGYNVKRAGG